MTTTQQDTSRLEQERAALATAKQALADADTRLDAQGIADATRLIDAHERIIAKLEAEVTKGDEVEREARARKKAKELAKSLNDTVDQIEVVQQEVIDKIGVVVEAIQREAALRSGIQKAVLGIEALCARFPSLRERIVVKEPSPAFSDYVGLIARPADQLYRLRRRQIVLAPSMTRPRDTEAQKQWEWLSALRNLVEKYPSLLPSEVLEIVTPLPDIGARPKDAPDKETFGDQLDRVLAGVGGNPGPLTNLG